jgi:hypothetical protein
MSTSLVRRLEKLEEVVERERAGKVQWTLYWMNPETGERTDAMAMGDSGAQH